MANGKNKYGQYMTPEIVADFMVSLANLKNDSNILEPCSGEGIFLNILKNKKYKNISAFEIDKTLIKDDFVQNESFILSEINKKFDLIIGNPPYIRWKNLENELKDELEDNNLWNKYCNALCDYSSIFILKSVELLKDGGELIFITPEYWLNTTHSIQLRNYLIENGQFEEIYHFNETPIFENATVSTIIFRYRKTKKQSNRKIKLVKYFSKKKLNKEILQNFKQNIIQKDTEYLSIPQFQKNKNWILASDDIIKELEVFENHCRKKDSKDFFTIKDFCDIGNGMVSGLDKAFQINYENLTKKEKEHTINVVKAKHLKPYFHTDITKYIYLNDLDILETDFKKDFPNFYNQLLEYKDNLNNRYQYNREIKYWDWVFLRNYKLFSRNEKRIFVPCKERISNKNYFRFSLIDPKIFPTQDVTGIFKKNNVEESIYYFLAFLNSKYVFDWLRFKGIIKGSIVEFSERPIASIPFRKIDFSKKQEVEIYQKIISLAKKLYENKDNTLIKKINEEIDKLFI